MAVLGSGGRLVLKRKAPYPCIISAQDLIDPASNQLLDICEEYLSGDRVQGVGLPVYVDGVPIKPNGWAMYHGGHFYQGPNRWHCGSETGPY